MKVNNKLLLKNLILCGAFLITTNINSYANRNIANENIDITHKSIVRSFKNKYAMDSFFNSVAKTQDGGLIAVGTEISIKSMTPDAVIVKYDKYGSQEWVKSFGGSGEDSFYSVIEAQDGGFIVVGDSDSDNAGFTNNGGYDAIIVKYDKNGNQLWAKNFGGSGNDNFNSITESKDGGFVAVGKSSSTNTGFTNKGKDDAIIVKYDNDGNQLWAKNFGGSGNDTFNSITESKDGGLITVGCSESANTGLTNNGGRDAIIIKYDKDGNQLWAKNFGGSSNDYFYSVIETQDGGFVAVGDSSSTNAGFVNNSQDVNYWDAIMVKFDLNGNQQWVKNFGGSYDDGFNSVIETQDGSFITVGYSLSTDAGFTNNGYGDAIIVKYDKDGNEQWIKNFGGSDDDKFNSVIETQDGGFVAVGYSDSTNAGFENKDKGIGSASISNAIIVKYDNECKKNENIFSSIKNLNTGLNLDDCFYSVIETQDRGFVAVGESSSTNLGFTNNGYSDAIIVKYDKNGNEQWIKNFGGSDEDCFNSVIETQDGGFIAVGDSYSTDAGFTRNGGYDAIIVKYDSQGNQQWVKNFGGSYDDYFNSVIEAQDGGFVAVGDSLSTNAGFTNNGGRDAIIIKYDKDGNQLWAKNFRGSEWDTFISVAETQDGGFVAVGNSNSTDAGFTNNGYYDAIVVKYDSNGNEQWIKNFGGSDEDSFKSVIETQDGGFVAVGYSDSTDAGFTNNGYYDAIVVKYDSNGNEQWIKNFGGSDDDGFNSVIETQDGGFVAVGASLSTNAGFTSKKLCDAIIVKYDSNSNQLWVKNFGGSKIDIFSSVIETQGGGFVAVGNSNSTDAGFKNSGENDAIVVKYDRNGNQQWVKSKKAEIPNNLDEFTRIREQVNQITGEELRRYLNEKLDKLDRNFGELELKTSSANLDVYIKSENMLLLSLDTNSVTFEDFSGVEDVVKTNAVNISINSSLPYQLNAYLPIEIQNSDKSNTMDKRILNIKENSEADYKEFLNINEKVVLKDNCPSGNDVVHGVDLKLVGGIAHEKDVYKTTIKFEAEQK